MKRLLFLLAFIFTCSLSAQDLNIFKGNFEVTGQGYLNQGSFGGDVRFGSFIADYVQIGVDLSYEDNDVFNRFSLGAYVNRLFETNTYLIPYVGVGLAMGSLDPEFVEGNSGVDIALFMGVKYFISENVSLNTELDFAYSTSETFVKDGEATDSDYGLTIGLSYYW
ncbi:hypothetical protein P3T73_17770 [Kiritimatiellota bacterium B12222]|nr:hypothetical protein P3T73_17770 [Kiritimatiellota bacterium B12222]